MTACATCALAIGVATSTASAQIVQASYPLLSDLVDASGNYGDMTLSGTPTPNAPDNGVCVNGVYAGAGGQDARTPTIASLTDTDFQIDLDFQLAALPTNPRAPILVGGNGWRWIGFYVQSNGTLGVLYNNSNYTWSTATVSAGTWYTSTIRFEAGNLELFLDGVLVHTAAIGTLTSSNNFNFTTNNFSNGQNHNGCIRNLVISNDATLGQTAIATATSYGASCDGLQLGVNSAPALGNFTFAFVTSNVPSISPIAFLGFGSSAVSPGVDLAAIGMTGCASHTSFDLGLYGGFSVSAGASTVALPILNDPTLLGNKLMAQALSLSGANPAGLAASNGVKLTFGL